MRRQEHNSRTRKQRRRGSAAVELVMATAVMVPVAGALFFLGIRISATLFQVTSATVGWSFL